MESILNQYGIDSKPHIFENGLSPNGGVGKMKGETMESVCLRTLRRIKIGGICLRRFRILRLIAVIFVSVNVAVRYQKIFIRTLQLSAVHEIQLPRYQF